MNNEIIEIDNKFYQKATVVMLPTQKADGALIVDNGKHTNYAMKVYDKNEYFTQEYLKSIDASSYYLYVLSNEEIKEEEFNDLLKNGLYFISDSSQNEAIVFNRVKTMGTYKKILTTTDSELKLTKEYRPEAFQHVSLPRPSNSFIEAYIRAYNKGNRIVDCLVEMKEKMGDEGIIALAFKESDYKLHVSPDNTTTIKSVELLKPRTYTKEEVIAFGVWYSGMSVDKVEKALDKYHVEKTIN
jgi:hypothetical protein